MLDPDDTAADVWAGTAYRSAANLALLLAWRGLEPQIQRAKPRGRPMPPHISAATPLARARNRVEHVFAAEKLT